MNQELIENALKLTGKTIEDMQEIKSGRIRVDEWNDEYIEYKREFSIEKFYAFLLSPEFIEKYAWYHIDKPASEFHSKKYEYEVCIEIGASITTYQSGNEKPLIELLQKI